MLRGDRLKQIRRKCGMTQMELAAACYMTHRRVSDYECGKRPNPTLATLLRFCSVLNCAIEEIIDYDY